MENKRFRLGALLAALVFTAILTSCFSTGHVRETVPQTALTLQRTRHEINADLPMQIYVNNVPHELANAEVKSIAVNNGEYVVHAVLGDQDTRSIRFTANGRSRTVTAGYRARVAGLVGEFFIEVN
jgi:hypothetical protein